MDEFGHRPAKSLGESPERLSIEPAERRASIGARSEPNELLSPAAEEESAEAASRQVAGATAAVKPLCDLTLDSLACVEAITASCIAGVPYIGLRDTVRFSDAQKAEIAEAVQRLVANHATVFAAHKDAIELGVALTAMQAAQLDHVLQLTADKEPLSRRQVLASLAIIFAPLLALLVVACLKRLQAGD
jgi:hypothetical protein